MLSAAESTQVEQMKQMILSIQYQAVSKHVGKNLRLSDETEAASVACAFALSHANSVQSVQMNAGWYLNMPSLMQLQMEYIQHIARSTSASTFGCCHCSENAHSVFIMCPLTAR